MVEILFELVEKSLEVSFPCESVLGEESFVVECNISDHGVEVLVDIIGVLLEFVFHEAAEIFKFLVVIVDDSSLGGDIDV